MLRLGHRRVLLNEPSVSEVAAPFSLDAYSADLKFAGSTARALLTSSIGAKVFRLRNSNSTTEGDVYAADLSSVVSANITALRDGVGELRINGLENQYSGAGAWSSPTQTTASKQMVVETAAPSRYTINGRVAFNSAGGTANCLQWGSAQTTGNSWAAVMVVYFTGTVWESGITGGDAVTQYFGQMSSGGRLHFVCASPVGTLQNYAGVSPGNGALPIHPLGNRPLVLTFRVKNGEQAFYINGRRVASKTVASNFPASVTRLGGDVLDSTSWRGQIAEFVVFNDADSAGVAAYTDNACQFYGARRQVIAIGDSLTYGSGSGVSGGIQQTYPQQLLDTTDFVVVSNCLAGWKISDLSSNMTSQVMADHFDRLPGSTMKPVCLCEIGINDLNTTDTAATVYTNLKTFWARLRTAGADLWAVTPSGAADGAHVTQQKLTDLTNLILSDASEYIGVTRLDNDPNIGIGQHANLTYFDADQTHLTTAGYGVVAGLHKANLEAFYPL